MATVSGPSGGLGATAWRVTRIHGTTIGVLLVVLGVWGGLIPFVGPRFGYAYTPDSAWTMTWGRLWLEVLPGAAVILGGLGLLGSGRRTMAMWSGWLAVLGGTWFILGPTLGQLWTRGAPVAGTPIATNPLGVVIREIGFFYGLGAVILFLAALALGRFSVGSARNADARR